MAETTRTFTALFPFCGLGAGARGFLQAAARLGENDATFTNLGGIDVDPLACADFEYLTGTKALCADINAITPEQLRSYAGERRPDVVFSSPPCKGYSRLLSKKRAETEKYQALNRLVLQALFLVCETWRDDPPPAIIIENVPGITSRGALVLTQVRSLLARYGYVFHEGTHNCGEIGGLAQNRTRFLLIARRPKAVPSFIYRPPRLRVKGCGEVLETLPMPEDPEAGPLHELPALSWLNWVRLALIPAGGDWRDLPSAVEVAGAPAELTSPVPAGKERRSVFCKYDVRKWEDPARTVAGSGTNGGFAVADPRVARGNTDRSRGGALGVVEWGEPAPTITGTMESARGTTPANVADPRIPLTHAPRRGTFGVVDWSEPAPTVRGVTTVRNGPAAVADPRVIGALALSAENPNRHEAKYRITPWDEPTHAVTGARPVTSGGPSVADPRLTCKGRNGWYGVMHWTQAAATVSGSAHIDNGTVAVADPRRPPEKGRVPVIVAADGTWHRPITKLELAALQGLPARVNGKPLRLATMASIGRKGEAAPSSPTERIGNAVPVGAARAIGESILTALLAAALGTWTLGSTGIWVRRDGLDENAANAPWLPADLRREEARFAAERW